MNLIARSTMKTRSMALKWTTLFKYDETRGKEALERAKTNIGLMIVGKEGRREGRN